MGVAEAPPPIAVHPPLPDGIHLRWASPAEQGFPWDGFYLFRRTHLNGTPTLLSSALTNLHKGPLPTNTLNTPYGQISSDRNLLLTDDFPPSGVVEFDLDNRNSTRFTL